MTLFLSRFRPLLLGAAIAIGSLETLAPTLSAAPLGTAARATLGEHSFSEEKSRFSSTHITTITAPTVSDLNRLFSQANYSLEDVSSGLRPVPDIFLSRLPHDLRDINDPDTLKTVFIQALLPLVLQANHDIRIDRLRLQTLQNNLRNGIALQFLEETWLEDIAARYDVADTSPEEQIKELLLRVDEIPASLALAQAIEESGWGTSKPARQGNSLFGHTVFLADGSKIRSFDSLSEGINAYFHNLNTHRAYLEFRNDRAAMRAKGLPLDSHHLVGKLTSYSARKHAYISTLRTLMRSNNLKDYDQARLIPATAKTGTRTRYGAALP